VSLNKDSPAMAQNKAVIGEGCMWSLQRCWKHLTQDGLDGPALW
jgi:peptide methionine sulfoxide reductase MsrA